MSGKLISCALAAFLLCGGTLGRSQTTSWPTDHWEAAAPGSVGLDSGTLAEALKTVRACGWRVDSIQVVRHGKLVLDAYFYPYTPGHPHDLRSGLAWTEQYDNKQSTIFLMDRSRDWVGFVLNLPMAAAPGSQFNYSGGNMNLLAAMIGKAWRMPAREVARTRLFQPLGITQFHWNGVDPDGNTIGESTLYLLPTDMARLGLFWLHDGVWQDRRILPAGWTGNLLADALAVGNDIDFYRRGFWVNRSRGYYLALGRHRQAILVYPALDMVIVVTGKNGDTEESHLKEVCGMILISVSDEASLQTDPAARTALGAMVREVAQPPARTLDPAGLGAAHCGKTWKLEANPLGITSLQLSADPGDAGAVVLDLGMASSRAARLRCGLDGAFRFNQDDDHPDQMLALKGKWWSPTKLVIEAQYPDSGRSTYTTYQIEFKGEDLTIDFADNEYFRGTIHSLARP